MVAGRVFKKKYDFWSSQIELYLCRGVKIDLNKKSKVRQNIKEFQALSSIG